MIMIGEPVILLVEDNPTDVLIFKQALARVTFKGSVFVVTDGQAALQYLSGAKPYSDRKLFPVPSIIFLDLRIPIFDGFHVLEWIRTEPFLHGIPVVILALSNAAEDIKRAYAFGASSFITKPANLDKLAADLKIALEHWVGKAHLKGRPEPEPIHAEERKAA